VLIADFNPLSLAPAALTPPVLKDPPYFLQEPSLPVYGYSPYVEIPLSAIIYKALFGKPPLHP